jgi:homoserine kinase
MELAIACEGHPDNVVPALLGNCQLSVGEMGNWQICQIPWHENIIPVVGIPNFELSTEVARAVLPKNLSRQDAIFNMAHLGLLLRALETGREDWLKTALQDKLHQPYRKSLIPGYEKVETAVLAAEAYGMVISGAGPTLLALSHPTQAEKVANAMKNAWEKTGITAEVTLLSLETQGTTMC